MTSNSLSTELQVIHSFPPNYPQICEVFPIKGELGIVFTYGDTLYVPSGSAEISGHLMAHERTHYYQQRESGPEAWWDKYLSDETFRLMQEVEAYRNQYAYLIEHHNRSERRSILDQISSDLASPMYGNLISKKKAKELISVQG